MTLTATITTLLVSFLLPAVVSLVTRATSSTWVKQFVAALAATVTGVIVTATQLDGTAVISKSAVVLAMGAFFASQVAYGRLYKPHNANARIAPNVGL